MITLTPLDRDGLAWANATVTAHHYLRRPVDPRTTPEGYAVHVAGLAGPVGLLLFGRPESTRCYPWYGSVDDVRTGRAALSRWQVLNLARVWLHPSVQAGGPHCRPELLPGYVDRCGVWRSTLATRAIRLALARIGCDYLLRRPPCFLDEPYVIAEVLSYCDPRYHRGVIYRTAGFQLYRTNARGLQTYRIPIPALTPEEDAAVRAASLASARSIRYRSHRSQLTLEGVLP